MKEDSLYMMAFWAAIVLILSGWLSVLYLIHEKHEVEQQRDEAYELARKAQNSAMYWYDVHEKMVWHTQPNEETK